MDFDERYKMYEDRYKSELDTREKIEGRVKTPFSLLIVVFGLIGYLFKVTVLSGNFAFDPMFWIAYVIAVILYLAAIVFFIKTIYGYHYLLVPTPEVLEEYLQITLDKYTKDNPSKAKQWTKEAFKEYLFECYVKFTSQNTKNNDTKSLNISRCLGMLIGSFIIVCASYFPYYQGVLDQKEKLNVQQTTSTATTSTEGCTGPATKSSPTPSSNATTSGSPKIN